MVFKNNTDKRRKWTSNSKHCSHDIKQIVNVKSINYQQRGKIQNSWAMIDKTSIGRPGLLTYAQILCMRKLLHDKQSTELRLEIEKALKNREKMNKK